MWGCECVWTSPRLRRMHVHLGDRRRAGAEWKLWCSTDERQHKIHKEAPLTCSFMYLDNRARRQKPSASAERA